MTSRRRPLAAAAVALAATVVGLPAASALADGLPVIGIDTTRGGVLTADGQQRYLAIPDGAGTLVAKVEADGGELVEQHSLPGRLSVPGVSLDATTGGLSRDGSTLVLIQPRVSFPQAETELAVVDPATLRLRRRITLEGDFSFDAISPDGATMYLVEYTEPRDPTRYRVRSYDVATGRLDPRPIIDASEPDEQMRGYPRTRVTGADGRWEYTLYDGGGGEPFVHALDTVAGTSRCIDLPWVRPRDVWRTSLTLTDGGATVAVVDTQRGAIAEIDTASAKATPTVASQDGAGDRAAIVAIALAGLAGAGLALAAMRRRRRGAPLAEEPHEGVVAGR